MRVEEGRIAGEDFTVWRWIQSDPPPTEEPPRSRSGRDGFWQGKVFEEYPPGMDSRIAPPAGQPSPCIRLKNMFDPVRLDQRGKGGLEHLCGLLVGLYAQLHGGGTGEGNREFYFG